MEREPSEQQDIFATADSEKRDSLQGSRSGSGQENSPKDTAGSMPAGKEALTANGRKGSKDTHNLTNDFSALSVGSIGTPHSVCLR